MKQEGNEEGAYSSINQQSIDMKPVQIITVARISNTDGYNGRYFDDQLDYRNSLQVIFGNSASLMGEHRHFYGESLLCSLNHTTKQRGYLR